MAQRKKNAKNARLPSAPLAEVIFELRWTLQPGPQAAPIAAFDPMLMPLVSAFSERMEEAKYVHKVDLAHPAEIAPYGVMRRFYTSGDAPFPLMQIGPGIFAANQSAQYEWETYKAQVLLGVRALLDSYPTQFAYALTPNQIELKYIDAFDKAVLGNSDFFEFMRSDTALKINLPEFFQSKQRFWGDASGRFVLQRSLRDRKASFFILDVAAAQDSKKDPIVRMESRVLTQSPGLPPLKGTKAFLADLSRWLEFAHGVTSPFFKTFITPGVMKKFQV